MTAGRYDTSVRQWATYNVTATWRDAAGTAVNLTGYTAAMDVVAADGSVVVDVGTSGTITLGGAAGTITITIPSAVTATMPTGNHSYVLFLSSAGGVRTDLLAGRFDVLPRVTV